MPKYLEIAKTLEAEIRQQLASGDLLASEADMAKRFQVNRHTVRRAIDELALSGLVERQQGVGTRVASSPYLYPLHKQAKFTQNLIEQGRLPSASVIKRRTIPASTKLAQVLNVVVDTPVMHMVTLRKVDGTPISLIDHYFPIQDWWSGLKHFSHGSIHEFIANQYQVGLQRQQTKVSASLGQRRQYELLNTPSRTPLLVFKTVNVITGTQQVAEYSRALSRGDLVEIQLEHS